MPESPRAILTLLDQAIALLREAQAALAPDGPAAQVQQEAIAQLEHLRHTLAADA